MTETLPRHIHAVRVQNVLAVEHVEIEPQEAGLTVIAGGNEQGKSSVLRAIELLVEYRAASRKVAQPLRKGSKKGWAELDLGDVKVRRTFTKKGTTLTVTPKGGEAMSAPQSFLDSIRPPNLLDPLGFSLMDPERRRRLMIQIAGLEKELEAAEREIESAEESRRGLGREARSAVAAEEALPLAPDGTPSEERNSLDLVRKLDSMRSAIRDVDAAREDADAASEDVTDATERVGRLRRELQEAELALAAASEASKEAARRAADLEKKCPPDEELRAAEQDLENLDQTNRAVRARKAKEAAGARRRAAEEAHAAAERAVDSAREKAAALVQGAAFPLSGLGFDEDDATFGGIVWSDLSVSRQLRIGLELGAAQHPGLPVFVIHRGESLDRESLAEVERWSQDAGVQVLIEVVGGDDHPGAYVIEAGRLREEVTP